MGIIACGNYQYAGIDPNLVSAILWTDDGGSHWVYKDVGNSDGFYLDARLASPTTAYVIGQYGQRKRTTDGGASWMDQYTISPYSGMKLFPINADTVYYAGLDNLSIYGAFGRTENGGQLWSNSVVSLNPSMRAIHFNDHLQGWIGGDAGEILRTNDGGFNWTPCITGVTSTINDMEFIDALNGWAVTDQGDILRSVDGGQNWAVEYSDTIPLWDVDLMPSGNIGYAVGKYGTVLKYGVNAGTGELSSAATLSIFPNPCSSSTTISMAQAMRNAEVTIYVQQGRLMQRMPSVPGSSVFLDTALLPAGLYFVSVLQDSSRSMTKFVVSAA